MTHAGIAIWGTLEARVQSADLVILGGLNKGIWPRLPGADPWLGRGIRRAIGLTSPERRIGLSAHDFQQATGARRVVLTRATRDAEAPTVASRWLLRLENLLLGLGPEGEAALGAAKARGSGSSPRRPGSTCRPRLSPRPAAPPRGRRRRRGRPSCPSPRWRSWCATPTGSTRATCSASTALDPPGRRPDALTRGKLIHAALDDFVTATAAGLPPDAVPALPQYRRGGAGGARALAGRPGDLDRPARPRLRLVPRQRGRPPRSRRTGGARAEGPARGRGPGPAFAITARADRIDRVPGGYAIYDYKSGTNPRPPRRGPSTCSCRSKPRSPRPAASRACRPLRRGTSSSEVRQDRRDTGPRRRRRGARHHLGALHRADRPLPRSRERLSRPAPAAEAHLGQRHRPPVAQGRVGGRRRPGG